MNTPKNIFKAYDIRGLVDNELSEELAYFIGHAFLQILKDKGKQLDGKKLVVGYDMRDTSKPFADQIIKAWTDAGVDVVNIGMTTTPVCNFAAAHYDDHAGSIMITASHNTSEYNGFKLTMEDALPIGKHNGMVDMYTYVHKQKKFMAEQKGSVQEMDVRDEYVSHIFSKITRSQIKPLNMVIDYGNGIGAVAMKKVLQEVNQLEVVSLYDTPDGSFPNHEANPLKTKTLQDLQQKVRQEGADFGLALDGDADRIGLVDEKGDVIEASFVGALFGLEVIKQHPGAHLLFDLRSSRSVKELWETQGATTQMSMVGHALIKKLMRETNATYASELSLHLYFDDMYGVESPDYAVLLLARILSEKNKPLSELIQPMKKYAHSGEHNFEVEDKERAIESIKAHFKPQATESNDIDGLWLGFEWGWFNVRESNTEPVLRLNLEAWEQDIMKQKVQEIKDIIEG